MNIRLLSVVALGILLAGCERTNPTLNSVTAAHGNTDWHIDTANEFLFGTDMGGNSTAANHAPESWNRTHIHIDEINTADYYHDSSKSGTGKDTSPLLGIDNTMLFFYAGHGAPTFWNTLGNNAMQSNMSLGNNAKDNWGVLRYYWQCSCDVFAHGPKTCPSGSGTDFDYSCPEHYDGSADSDAMRSVYDRWSPALGKDLRMACGVSTLAYCHEGEANRIWDNYNNKSYDVADSFIFGLHGNANVVPLCITRGNSDVTTSPLYDQTFTNQKNPVGSGLYLHIQYLSNFAKRPPLLVFRVPETLAIYALKPMRIPDRFANVKFIEKNGLKLSEEQIDRRGAKIRIHPTSGAFSVLGSKATKIAPALAEERYLELASQYLRDNGWTENDMGEPAGSRMKLEGRATSRDLPPPAEQQKSVNIEFKRQIVPVGSNEPIPVLGEGGKITLQMNNDGSVFAASKVWRELGDMVQMAAVKPYPTALLEATRQLGNFTNQYQLKQWQFGYVEGSGNVGQEMLHAAYQFTFEPIEERLAVQYPPRQIQIAATNLP